MSSNELATEAELQQLNALDTVEGQCALSLARAIDSGRALMAAPSMVKELRATLDVLRERTPKAKDTVDDFSARRAARRAAQG
jgi:hypothetical protein